MDLSSLKTDQKLENEGVWVDLDPTTQIKITAIGSRPHRKALKKRMGPYQRIVAGAGFGAIPEEDQDGITVGTLVDGVLLGWRSKPKDSDEKNKDKWPPMIYVDGEAIEFSKDEATRLLTEIPRFRQMVSELANSVEAFKSQGQEEMGKN